VISDLKKWKLRNWSKIIKDGKVWNNLVQNIKTYEGCSVRRRKEGEF
jgi:hypothetical protein